MWKFARRSLFLLIPAFLASGCFGVSSHTEAPPAASPEPAQLGATIGSPAEGAGEALTFAVVGDWGKGTAAQGRIADIMCEVRTIQPFTYVLTVGDNFYSPDGTATDKNYYVPEKCLYTDAQNQWRAAWGNHDYSGASTSSVLGAPSSPRYYTWTAGDVAFFVYDGTNVTSQQRQWLRDQVCGSTARVKIIYGHQPAYSVGPHGSDADVRGMVEPVARDCAVQLVLAGHDHLYERSKPIDGVTYVVSGGGGGETYDCQSSPDWLELCAAKAHFLLAEVTASSIRIKAIGLDGTAIDSFEVPLKAGGH